MSEKKLESNTLFYDLLFRALKEHPESQWFDLSAKIKRVGADIDFASVTVTKQPVDSAEEIERVAKALFNNNTHTVHEGFFTRRIKWEELAEGGKEHLRNDAKAAIAAMSPKREMVARKLVWVPSGETDVCADKEIAEIKILVSHSGKAARYGVRKSHWESTWQVYFWCGNIGMWSKQNFLTIEDAKKAAQQHYDSIVRENTLIEGDIA